MLALVVAVTAVVLGLGLGLAPGASRRALGPLRTLALAAVIGVALMHLLPEAFSALGVTGLVVFALGLALPRWLTRVRRESDGHRHALSLELGFWGLIAHHVGDGLALGAYSRMDEHTGHSHADVLLALVLHTVPLVAVVSAGYARSSGVQKAALRAGALALASVVGIFAARLVPPDFVESARAWIAAAVAGLLLHGMSHDIGEDLPQDRVGRVLDLGAAFAGAMVGWIGARLDAHHHDEGVANVLAEAVTQVALVAAFPLLVGLLLAMVVIALPVRYRASPFYAAAEPRGGTVLAPEALMVTLALFGWLFSLAAYLLSLLGVAFAAKLAARDRAARTDRVTVSARARDMASAGTSPDLPAARFAERLDHVSAWAFAGMAGAGVLALALSETAFSGMSRTESGLLGVFIAVALPFHAMVAPIAGSVLASKGLWLGAVLVLCVVGPFLLDLRGRRWIVVPVLVALSLLLGSFVNARPLRISTELSQNALIVLCGLVLARIYHLGFRGWLVPLGPRAERGAVLRATTSAQREREGQSGDHALSRGE